MNNEQRSLLSVALLLIALLVIVPVTLAAILGDHRQNLSFTRTDAGQPAIAVTSNRVGAVWVDARSATAGIQGTIYFRGAEFDDSGGPFSFSQAKFVGNSAASGSASLTPDIASDPVTTTNMHLVWKRNQPDPAAILYARCVVDGSVSCDGVTAGAAEQTLVEAAETGDEVNDPALATSDNGAAAGVHVVWQYDDADPATQKIYYRGSNDGGETFNSQNLVSGSDVGAMRPAIATDDTYVHVVWIEDSDGDERGEYVKYARGTLTGGTVPGGWAVQTIFAATNPASDNPSYPDYPAVVAMSGIVMILWDSYSGVENGFELDPSLSYYGYYALSTDNGGSFDTPAIIEPAGSPRDSDENPTNNTNEVDTFAYSRRLQIEAAIAPDTAGKGADAVVYAVWHQTYSDPPNRYHDVFLAQYGAGSCEACGTWIDYDGAPSNETNGNKEVPFAYSASPDIATADGKIHLIYMEGDTAVEVDVEDVLWDVFYNNNFADITATANPGTFLPIILKNQ